MRRMVGEEEKASSSTSESRTSMCGYRKKLMFELEPKQTRNDGTIILLVHLAVLFSLTHYLVRNAYIQLISLHIREYLTVTFIDMMEEDEEWWTETGYLKRSPAHFSLVCAQYFIKMKILYFFFTEENESGNDYGSLYFMRKYSINNFIIQIQR